MKVRLSEFQQAALTCGRFRLKCIPVDVYSVEIAGHYTLVRSLRVLSRRTPHSVEYMDRYMHLIPGTDLLHPDGLNASEM